MIRAILALTVVFFNCTSLAITEEKFSDCVFENPVTQIFVGSVKSLAQEKYVTETENLEMIKQILSEDIKNCDQVNSVVAQVLAKGMKAKANVKK